VTEQDWLTCTDPKPMLDFIQPRASERKLRLFLVACARLGWDRLPPGEMREAVEVAERYADGLATDDERQRLSNRMWSIPVEYGREVGGNWFTARPREDVSAYMAAMGAVGRMTCGRVTSRPTWESGAWTTGPRQPDLLRDIFGPLPFRSVAVSPQWFTDDVISPARRMYESRDFGAMPILADALQDAGCDSEDIFDHCRSEGPHCRGCWVVDLLLGKS
jgi:hypothetical protein